MQLRLISFLAFMLCESGSALAQSCSFSNTGINFGNVNLTSGGFQSASGTFSAQCTGNPGQKINICANFNAGSGGIDPAGSPRFLRQGAIAMRYDLFRSNGVGQSWGSHTWSYPSRPPPITITLNGSGFGSASQSIFGRLYNQQSAVPTGTFSSTFSGANTQIDYGYSQGFSCGPTLSPRVQNVPFIVRATNNSSCVVTATDLNFGSHSTISSSIASTNTITATCTAGTQYEIGLNNGSSGASDPAQRRMTNPATADAIGYSIYRDGGRTQVWGNTTGANTMGAIGTGAAQTFTGYGLVPLQTTPASLVYSDTVIVVVTY
jgi:spore coat protein U-like protein